MGVGTPSRESQSGISTLPAKTHNTRPYAAPVVTAPRVSRRIVAGTRDATPSRRRWRTRRCGTGGQSSRAAAPRHRRDSRRHPSSRTGSGRRVPSRPPRGGQRRPPPTRRRGRVRGRPRSVLGGGSEQGHLDRGSLLVGGECDSTTVTGDEEADDGDSVVESWIVELRGAIEQCRAFDLREPLAGRRDRDTYRPPTRRRVDEDSGLVRTCSGRGHELVEDCP